MLSKEHEITLQQAKPLIIDCIKAGLVAMLRGSPGLGKSALTHAVGAQLNLKVIDVRMAGCDPTDINGFPDLDRELGYARYFPLETFPLDDWQLPINEATGKPYDGWLIFLDEFNSAPPAVQAASYKLVLDRMVGLRKLHPKAAVMAAGNLDSDGAITHEMSTALINRVVNLQIKVDLNTWMEWADEAGISTLITSFLKFRPGHFYTFNPSEPNQPFASPRTWEFVSKLMKIWEAEGQPVKAKTPLLVGTLSGGVATEFKAFALNRANLPAKEDIINNPDTAVMPSDLGPMWAMTGALADWADGDNLGAILKYVDRMEMADFQVTTIRSINARHPDLRSHDALKEWMKANMHRLLGKN